MRAWGYSLLALISFSVASICLAPPAVAQATYSFNLPEEPLADSLRSIGQQTQLNILFEPDAVRHIRSPALRGAYTADDAIRRLLQGTKLQAQHTTATNIVIKGTPTSSNPVHVDGEGAALNGQDNWGATGSTRLAQGTEVQSGPMARSGEANDVAKAEDTKGLAEILVKGSRIMNVDVVRTQNDAQPYTILDAQAIQQSSASNVEDFLKQQLTANTLFQTNTQVSGASAFGATSGINLRGLGTNETLILVNGRRVAGVNTVVGLQQPDINGIPLASIERIEVLPSSASAIYGGAALGGVVNIILKKNFNGGEISAIYNNTTSGSAPLRTVNATYGASLFDDRTHIMVSGSYSDGSELQIRDRLNLVERGINSSFANSPSFFLAPFNPFSGATTNIASVDGSNLVLKNGAPLNSPITYVPKGATPGSNINAALLNNAGYYNLTLPPGSSEFGLQTPIGAAPTVKALMATVRQEITSSIEGFTEFITRSNSTHVAVNALTNVVVPRTAPDNPFVQDVLVNIPTAATTPLNTDSVTQSVTVGLLAHLPFGWMSELDYSWSKSSFESSYDLYDSAALATPLSNGTLNPFADTIAHPLDLSGYLAPTTYSGASTLNDLALRASGPLVSLPGGHITLTIGLEHRKEGFSASNAYTIYPLTPVNNLHTVDPGQSQSTNSVYAEAQVPLIGAQTAVPLVESLDLQLAGRTEHYTVFAGPDTVSYTSSNPTLGLKYQPVRGVIFRTSYSRAFLPPLSSQLIPNSTPECLASACVPITDPKNGLSYNVDLSGGGNPALKPQTAKTWDAGVIWEPESEALKGLRADVEYYRIAQPNYITTPSPQQIVSDASYANRVTRDPATGLISIVNVAPVNATEYKTAGFDLTLEYRRATGLGTFGVRARGTAIKYDLRQYTIGSSLLNYVGFPAEGGEAKYKASATASWDYRGWELGWTATYVGSYFQGYGSPGSPFAAQNGPLTTFTDAQGGFSIPHQTYHDLFASYSVGEAPPGGSHIARAFISNAVVSIGVKNIFNTLPPFDAYNIPYFYSTYGDPRLRTYQISFKKGF